MITPEQDLTCHSNYDMPSAQHGGIDEYVHRIGRTARIGNKGQATSFYNDRDSDLGEGLVKLLLESKQVVPDFLQQFVPEGGVVTWDDDTDDEGEEAATNGANGTNGDSAGGWGTGVAVPNGHTNGHTNGDATNGDSGGWGSDQTAAPKTTVAAANDSWGAASAW